MLLQLPTTWFLAVGTLLAATACRDEKPAPFLLEVDIRPATNAPAGISFSVNGEDTSRIWQGNYTSLEASCAYLEENPLQIACLDLDGTSCGLSEVFGVCCWAPNVVSSPIVKGTLYVSFAGNGTADVAEGNCEAADGSSTHGDEGGPDGGPSIDAQQ